MPLDLLPEALRECLRQCAVPLSFDASTFDELLYVEGGPDLPALVAMKQVEVSGRRQPRYRLSRGIRESALQDWWVAEGRPPVLRTPVPAGLRRAAERLKQRAVEAGRSHEVLHLALLCDPVQAAELFRRLYAQADSEHDLGRCRALLDVLDGPDRRPLLGVRLAALRNDHVAYLAARTMWVDDYYRSAEFLQRNEARQALEALLGDDGPRVLQLHADGGTGKTTQLRWFLSRRCVPARIPCARVDFDTVHPVVVARHPWLLLLDVAAQLDRQLTGAPFQELLAAHGRYRNLLPRNPSPEEASAAPRYAPPGDGEDVLARFCAVVSEIPTHRRVVIVLDTLEEAFRPSITPTALLDLVRDVLEAAPSVRFVFAGRYDIRTLLDTEAAPLRGLLDHKIPRLSDEEQRRYLVDIRRISDGRMVEQIIALSEGLPLTMSLYANLVTSSHGITREELAANPEPGLVRAIERVVRRVDPRVQWLLRYGVVPRRLCFDFVVDVMWPYLRDGMSGRSGDDAPELDATEATGEPVFPCDLAPPADEDDLRSIWDALAHYAADDGWVSVSADGWLCFRPDLLEPLRGLIRSKPVFRRMHSDAADYWERRAAAEPGQWLSWCREAVFHRLQVDLAAGADAWRSAVRQAQQAGRDDWCLDLATALTHGREFVDWNGAAVPPMTSELLAEAHLERARAAAALAEDRLSGDEDPLWSDVEEGLGAARALARQVGLVALDGRLRVLAARLAVAHSRPGEAERLLRELGGDARHSSDRADVERSLGRALVRTRRPGAEHHLRASYDLAAQAGDRPGARLSALLLARQYDRLGRYPDALLALRTAQGQRQSDDLDADLVLLEAKLRCESGSPARGGELARTVVETGRKRAAAHLALAWSCYREDQPAVGVDHCSTALALAADDPEADDDIAGMLAVRGRCRAELHMYDLAVEDLLAAASSARELRDVDAAAEHAGRAALVAVLMTDDLRLAAQCLDEAERGAATPASAGWVMTRLARARLLAARGDRSGALNSITATSTELRGAGPAGAGAVQVAILCLELAPPHARGTALRELTATLQSICPPSARLLRLSRLREVPVLRGVDATALSGLVGLVDHVLDEGAGLTTSERTALAWRYAEVLRVAGRAQQARTVLDRARLDRNGDLLGWWRWLEAMTRLSERALPGEAVPPDQVLHGGQFPVLTAACQVTLAQRRVDVDPVEVVEARLRAAEFLLSDTDSRNAWLARAAEVRARLGGEHGNEDTAHRNAAAAAAAYSRLGATVAQDRVAHDFRLGERSTRVDAATLDVAFSTPQSGAVDLQVRRPDEDPRRFHASLPEALVPDATRPLARVRRVFGPLEQGWRAWSEQVASHVLSPEVLARLVPAEDQHRDVRLVFASRDLAAWPWELCRVWEPDRPLAQATQPGVVYRSLPETAREEAKNRAVQTALSRLGLFSGVPDGLEGRRTAAAVHAFQQQAGLVDDGIAGRATWAALRHALSGARARAPRAVVLRPHPRRQLERQRGYTAAGPGLSSSYARHGVDVQIMDDPTLSAVRAAARAAGEGTPDMVHVTAPVRLSGGATVVDIGGDAGSWAASTGDRGSGAMSVHALGELVSAAMRGGRAPLLVLDVPMPASRVEALRALGVRNSLAQQLLTLGVAQAVLATGLAVPEVATDLLDEVLGGLAQGRDVAQVVTGLHGARSADEGLAELLPYLGTALFLERPPWTLLPWGT